MKKILIILCVAVANSVSAQHQGIQLRTNPLPVLLKESKKKNMLVMIDCQTSWCKPCRWVEANVFPNDTVGAFFNEHFISTSIDMEKGEGIAIAKKYDIHCYPTFLFLDGNGKVIHRYAGVWPTEQTQHFVELGRAVLDVTNRYATFDSLFTTKTMSALQFIHYLDLRNNTCLPIANVMADYEAITDPEGPDAWLLLQTVVEKPDSRLFQYMLAHREAFGTVHTSDSVDMIIQRIYFNVLMNSIYNNGDSASYFAMRDSIQRLHIPTTEKILQKAHVNWYSFTGQWNMYIPALLAYMEQYRASEDAESANDYAWTLYEHSTDRKHLEAALIWAQYSISQSPSYYNTDSYAVILYTLGKYQESRTWANISIQLAKEIGVDYSETEKVLRNAEQKLQE